MSFARTTGGTLAYLIQAATLPLGLGRVRNKTLAHASDRLAPTVEVRTQLGILRFRCPNAETVRVPSQFSSWEPETARWVERIVGPDDCVWDIGAHIGMVALYAGLRMTNGRGQVIAFEPSASNYAVLNTNIMLSGLVNQVKAYCVALSDHTGVGRFHMRNPSAGHDLNSFGDARNFRGDFIPAFSQAVLTFSVDDAISILKIPTPDHIKLDVDSIEEKILAGGALTLKSVKSLLIEIESERSLAWKETVYRLLAEAGLVKTSNPGRFERAQRPFYTGRHSAIAERSSQPLFGARQSRLRR